MNKESEQNLNNQGETLKTNSTALVIYFILQKVFLLNFLQVVLIVGTFQQH